MGENLGRTVFPFRHLSLETQTNDVYLKSVTLSKVFDNRFLFDYRRRDILSLSTTVGYFDSYTFMYMYNFDLFLPDHGTEDGH